MTRPRMNEWRKFMMSNDKDNDKNMRICMVGGQALMEGIMMRGELDMLKL